MPRDTKRRKLNNVGEWTPRDTRGPRKSHNRVADKRTADQVLADEMNKYRHDPLGYVMFNFPWDTEPSIQIVPLAAGVEERMTGEDRARRDAYRARFPNCKYGPDLWACDFLEELGRETRERNFDGRTPVDPVYFATVSGHEIGKSALVAWLTKWILDTRPHSKGSITAVTDEQLRTKTWAEVGKWHRMSLTEHWFEYNSSRGNMSLVHRKFSEWAAHARTARKEKSESFAGQHAPSGTSFYIFDEASGIEPKIFEVREGGLTSGEPMVFDFGNGTVSSGPFYEECEGRLRDRYRARAIDSRSVAITNKRKIQADVDIYGEEDDFVRVRWRGMFPERGFSQFIATSDVEAAMARESIEDRLAPLVLGVDVARFGDDDSVVWPRRGRDARSFEPDIMKGFDTTLVLDRITERFNYFAGLGTRPAMIFVDVGNTGGAIVDFLRRLGYPVTPVAFGANPYDKTTYRFMGDEIWGRLRDHIREGLVLPTRDSKYGNRLHAEMTQRNYGFLKGTERMHLEPKPDMKSRGLNSPDMTDALAVTYFMEVGANPTGVPAAEGVGVQGDYDPYEALAQ